MFQKVSALLTSDALPSEFLTAWLNKYIRPVVIEARKKVARNGNKRNLVQRVNRGSILSKSKTDKIIIIFNVLFKDISYSSI